MAISLLPQLVAVPLRHNICFDVSGCGPENWVVKNSTIPAANAYDDSYMDVDVLGSSMSHEMEGLPNVAIFPYSSIKPKGWHDFAPISSKMLT